jgi:hypothetical protein
VADVIQCSLCGATIRYVRMAATRALIGVDAAPSSNGNIAIVDGTGYWSGLFETLPDGERFKAHDATCPNRKGRK